MYDHSHRVPYSLVAYMYSYEYTWYYVSLCATITGTEYDKLAMVHCMVQYGTILPGMY